MVLVRWPSYSGKGPMDEILSRGPGSAMDILHVCAVLQSLCCKAG